MSRRGTFGHPVDTWSGDLAGAEAHARYHSTPSARYQAEPNHLAERCDCCCEVLVLKIPDSPLPGAVYFECANCDADYSPDEVLEDLHPERNDG